VIVATSLTPPGGGSSASAAKKTRIVLKPVRKKVKAGRPVPFKIKIPHKIAKKYAGQKLRATIKVTARDALGNKRKVTKRKKLRLAKLKIPRPGR
jgi:hypothetical protein